jgi:Uncharacterised protein family (UPF0175)
MAARIVRVIGGLAYHSWEVPVQVTLDLPDDISKALEGQWSDLPRQALEALAVEGYRTGALTENQVQRLLGFESRFQVHAILKDHRVPMRYTQSDLEDDLAAHREIGVPHRR